MSGPPAVERAAARRDRTGRTVVLGVSAHYHDSAAALTVDGQIVAAAQEERFTRCKNDPSLPEKAITYVLEHAGVAPSDLTAVAFHESPFAKFDRLLATQMTGSLRGVALFTKSMTTWLPTKLRVGAALGKVLDKDVPVLYGDHHLSHAASAFYPSPYEEAAVLTVDGVGEWTTTSIGRGCGSDVELLEHIEYPNSLGMLYSTLTAYCGFRVNSGEYKLMGLAPYGEPVHADLMLTELIDLRPDGSFTLNPEYFTYVHTGRASGRRLARLLGGPARRESEPLRQRHADIAASTQTVLNQAMAGLAARARAVTGLDRLVLAGGVALNVVATSHLQQATGLAEVWTQPAAGDAGGALGAALWATHAVLDVPRSRSTTDSMSGAFLGPTPLSGDETAAEVASRHGLRYLTGTVEELEDAAAALLADGGIVAVARGRMEFGPRALGNRSILADARDPGMQRRLNLATKFREGFRPFAPVVLAEHADVWFDLQEESPYMLKTYPVRGSSSPPRATGDGASTAHEAPGAAAGDGFLQRLDRVGGPIPAVTHVDGSARVQTVDAARNPRLHSLLTRFHQLTGCPVLVNTSFNVRGEPIVCSADDAVYGFLRSDIDALLLEDVLIVRAQQDPAALARQLPKVDHRD